MQAEEFLFFIKNNDGLYGQYVNGVVLFTGIPTPLQQAPEGWDETKIEWTQNDAWFSLDRSLSLPFKMVGDGLEIVRYCLYTYGPEYKLFLQIAEERLFIDAVNYYFFYYLIHECEIDDLNNTTDSFDDIDVNLLEGGAIKDMKAKLNFNYQIKAPTEALLKLDGVPLQQQAKYIVTNGTVFNNLGGHTLAMTLIGTESVNQINAVSQDRVVSGNVFSTLWNNNNKYLTTGAQPTTVKINFNIDVYLTLADGIGAVFGTTYFLRLFVLQSDTVGQAYNIASAGGGAPGLIYNHWNKFAGTVSIVCPPNSKLILYMTATQNRDFTYYAYDNATGFFDISYDYTHRTTYTKLLTPSFVWNSLISNITQNRYTGISPLFDQAEAELPAAGKKLVRFASGDMVRALPDSFLTTNLQDFFAFWDLQADIGLVIDELNKTVSLDRKSAQIDWNSPVDLGEVSSPTVSHSVDRFFNYIKIGYPKVDLSDVNGKQSFCTTHEYSVPITRVTKLLDKTTQYIADAFVIELTRINVDGKTTTDNQLDDSVLCFDVTKVSDLEYILNRKLNATTTGFLRNDLVFNLSFATHRCMLENGAYIEGVINREFFGTKQIVFQKAERNQDSIIDGIVEKSNVDISALPTRYFRSYYFSFVQTVPDAIFDIINEQRRRVFSFTIQGVRFKGLALKISCEPYMMKTQTYKLLAAPDTSSQDILKIKEQ